MIDFFNGSFEMQGLDVYRAHYRWLEDMMGGGEYLEYTVEDERYVARFSAFNALY